MTTKESFIIACKNKIVNDKTMTFNNHDGIVCDVLFTTTSNISYVKPVDIEDEWNLVMDGKLIDTAYCMSDPYIIAVQEMDIIKTINQKAYDDIVNYWDDMEFNVID